MVTTWSPIQHRTRISLVGALQLASNQCLPGATKSWFLRSKSPDTQSELRNAAFVFLGLSFVAGCFFLIQFIDRKEKPEWIKKISKRLAYLPMKALLIVLLPITNMHVLFMGVMLGDGEDAESMASEMVIFVFSKVSETGLGKCLDNTALRMVLSLACMTSVCAWLVC